MTSLKLLEIFLIAIFAFIPVLVWIPIFHYKKNKSPKLIGAIFLLGTLTVTPIIGLQYLSLYFPFLDVYAHIDASIKEVYIGALLTFIFVGIFEEIAKQTVIHVLAHTKTVVMETINDVMLYSVIAALGFSFTENIIYLYNVFKAGNIVDTMSVFGFRSIVTMCAHMVFSGIMGYYYGMAKFAEPMFVQETWEGKKFFLVELFYKIFKINKINTYKFRTVLEGLLIAMTLHAIFNFLLQFGLQWQALMLVFVSYLFIQYLMRRRAGQVNFDIKNAKPSIMDHKNEDVVIELLGMWINEGKYLEVKEICERLLQKDPDNPVVKLFKAKAEDKLGLDKAVTAIKGLFSEEEIKERKSIFEKGK